MAAESAVGLLGTRSKAASFASLVSSRTATCDVAANMSAWITRAGRSANESKKQIPAYAKTAGAWRREIRADSGKQPGDPVRAVQALINAVESPKPPRHLLLGNDAYEGAMAKLDELRKDFSAVEKIARGADFPKEKSSKVK